MSIPGSMWASNSAAPTPVAMAQPNRAADANGSVAGIGMAAAAGTTTYGQNAPVRRKGMAGMSSRR